MRLSPANVILVVMVVAGTWRTLRSRQRRLEIRKEMRMFKTILVPLDGSKRAEAILPYVEELARQNLG